LNSWSAGARPPDFRKDLVEAAGIEPASEKVRHEKTTCVSGSLFVGGGPVSRQDDRHLARLISILGSEQKPLDLSCHMTLTSYDAGLATGAAT
jgi:hypothetical protein